MEINNVYIRFIAMDFITILLTKVCKDRRGGVVGIKVPHPWGTRPEGAIPTYLSPTRHN